MLRETPRLSACSREAGSRAAQTVLVELPKVLSRFPRAEELTRILEAVRLLEKTGGASGDFRRDAP